MPSFSASRAAWSGAAPPKAIRVRSRSILAALDGVHARGVGHVLVDHLADAERPRASASSSSGAPIALSMAARAGAASSGICRRRSGRIDAAEHEIGVGDGRLGAAAAVAGRARLGAGAVRADRDRPQRVDPGDRAAAGADLDHLDHGDAQRQPAALHEAVDARHLEDCGRSAAAPGRSGRSWRWCRPCRRTAPGQAALRARCGRRRWRRRPGRIRPGGPGSGSQYRARQAAARQHEIERARRGRSHLKLARQAVEIARHQRLDIGVAGGG